MSHPVLTQTFFRLEVSETDKDREYWASREWSAHEARSAEILILPWEDFRDGKATLFPEGTSLFVRELRSLLPNNSVAVAVQKPNYEEIALHSRHYRFPTLLVSFVLLPIVVQVVANRIDRALPPTPEHVEEKEPAETIEMEILIEGHHGHCISIKYVGPANELAETIVKQAEACLPKLEKTHPRRVP